MSNCTQIGSTYRFVLRGSTHSHTDSCQYFFPFPPQSQEGLGSELPGSPKNDADEKAEPEKSPASLAEKVAADFKRPSLVQPCEKFRVKGTQLSLFADLKAGQKHPMDKPHNITAAPKTKRETKSGEDGGLPILNFEYTVP